ncbi:radical SAM protein [Usitatibacter palustris]|uniref:Mycofactocin radical SAM maturase MftC n=1 Tax=Usitatibacter palustris TaxID=2732487 RepID=A0A6M4H8D6_9PROT|nr:radical SAM protein [Usitatibacter palustris]QJR15612.1 Putative mycofactocin radical SAM maturase MftC [Usitatibacter palustris]
MSHRIDALRSPLLITWQLTRDCDLACLHCCTDSAPGKRLPDELTREEALRLADDIVANEVPYVMLAGGEPLVAPHFFEVAESLGSRGVQLKIETNGQRFDAAIAQRLAKLPIRSIQISLDGDTEEVYAKQRPGGSLARAHEACHAVREAGLPLEITFAPTRINLHEARAVIDRARSFGAFRFNSGRLMRVGTAARHWNKVAPAEDAWVAFRTLLREAASQTGMEMCFEPFSLEEALASSLGDPPATLLVLPNGWVKVAAALPQACADLRRESLAEAWGAYQRAWHEATMAAAVRDAVADESRHARANVWQLLPLVNA